MFPISFGILPVNLFHMKSLRHSRKNWRENKKSFTAWWRKQILLNSKKKECPRIKNMRVYFPFSKLSIFFMPYNICMYDKRPSSGDRVPERFIFNSCLQQNRQQLTRSNLMNRTKALLSKKLFTYFVNLVYGFHIVFTHWTLILTKATNCDT